MKKIPEALLQSLEGLTGFDQKAFTEVHASGEQVTSIRVNTNKISVDDFSSLLQQYAKDSRFLRHEKIPWAGSGLYLKQRPSFTFDPFFHAGLYYVQEASSMFLEQALLQLIGTEHPIKLLDLCAAPGGKSTHLQSLVSPDSLVVSNEVIRGRSRILQDNMIKWGAANVIVTGNDPSAFQKLGGYFDVMVVDAPCSGSGLFRRDEDAIEEWSLNNVELCSQRQKRILADALPSLKENGLLVYSTCSYSREEDEDIADWLVEACEMDSIPLQLQEQWNVVRSLSSRTQATGYRFYPDKIKGEGFFIACFRKKSAAKPDKLRPFRADRLQGREKSAVLPWLRKEEELLKTGRGILSLPATLLEDYLLLSPVLAIQYAGVGIGQIMKEKLVPDHALALSVLVSGELPANALSYEEAIAYLQRREVAIGATGKGWQLVRYGGYNLGWVNVLASRVNNYYPKELRILKQVNDSSFEK